ncbi:MAG: trypsin-like peptidase domain-containing protein [Actinomycetota bacterium]|nr:trypsin-like peptidase domain-containing protein [Actinomycetota bacterium]
MRTRSPIVYAVALLAAGILGGVVALAGAATFDVFEGTTIREVGASGTAAEISEREDPSPGGTLTEPEIYRRAAPAVVQITSTSVVRVNDDPFGFGFGPRTSTQRSLGSGFVRDNAGHIVTNYHVISQARSIEVSFSNNESMKATVVGTDPATDIAVLKVDARSLALRPLPLGDSDDVRVGDRVVAIGNPFGRERSMTAGIVSALQREIDTPGNYRIGEVIQTDAPLNRGNSGGPLLNMRGDVVGVNSAIQTGDVGSTGNVGIGFAIPINTVKDVVRQLIEKGRVDHAYLGVSVQEVDAEIARLFNLPRDHGLLVREVEPGSAAADAGLKAGKVNVVVEGESYPLDGDLIVKVDGAEIVSASQLRNLVASKKPGDEVQIELYRERKNLKVDVKLGRQPAPPPP